MLLRKVSRLKKVLTHLKKNWIYYGAGSLLVASVVQSQGWVDFDPLWAFIGTTTDQAMRIKDIVLGYAVGGFTLFKTGKAVVYPVIAEYQNTKKVISERETIVKEAEMRINEDLANVTRERNEADKARIEQLKRQNDILELIKLEQKSLPEIIKSLNIKIDETKEEFEDNDELEA